MALQSFTDYVEALDRLVAEGERLPLGRAKPAPATSPEPDAPVAIIISPHPDDEAIIGALPLRMLRQGGYRVVNLTVTLGSDKGRQSARLEELKNACAYLGFDLQVVDDCGLERVSLMQRREDPRHWIHSADAIAMAVRQHSPDVIFYPHPSDANRTHMGVHGLTNHALLRLGGSFSAFCVETEFWSTMDRPNLMVESSVQDVGELVTALSFHEGEVQRNPYHVRLPAWMIDNVRRGAEVAGGQGAESPAFRFATLYRMRRWKEGKFHNVLHEPRFLARDENPADLFDRSLL